MTFGFGDKQCLDIISIYGIAMGGVDADQISKKNGMRKTIIFAIKKIKKQWRKRFPSIHVIILGDLQETISGSDIDNLG